jgi:hypothetical protein
MKMTIGKTLHINVDSVAIVDGFEANAPYCQSSGERQVVIDSECFEMGLNEGRFNRPSELRKAAGEIAKMVEIEKPGDINIYC